MPNIMPVSELRNYNEVLKAVSANEPVFLTKNGRGKYAIIDIADYERDKAAIKLLSELNKGEAVGDENGWLTLQDMERRLGLENE